MKLTETKLRQVIREEVRSLSENVDTESGGTISFSEEESGFALTVEDSDGSSVTLQMTKDEADELHDLVMGKV